MKRRNLIDWRIIARQGAWMWGAFALLLILTILTARIERAHGQNLTPTIEPAPDPGPVIVPQDARCVNDRDYIFAHPVECSGNMPATFSECVSALESRAMHYNAAALHAFQLWTALSECRANLKTKKKGK